MEGLTGNIRTNVSHLQDPADSAALELWSAWLLGLRAYRLFWCLQALSKSASMIPCALPYPASLLEAPIPLNPKP